MIYGETKILGDCDCCDKEIDFEEESSSVLCEKCETNVPVNIMKETMENIADEKEWENFDGYIGFNSEKEKKQFMKGIRCGIEHCFFKWAMNYGDEGINVFDTVSRLFRIKKK